MHENHAKEKADANDVERQEGEQLILRPRSLLAYLHAYDRRQVDADLLLIQSGRRNQITSVLAQPKPIPRNAAWGHRADYVTPAQ